MHSSLMAGLRARQPRFALLALAFASMQIAACSDDNTAFAQGAGGTAAPIAAKDVLRGVNISGGEFGGPAPGKMFTNYAYPTKEEVDYYARSGLGIVRVPFLWERLQPEVDGSLSDADVKALKEIVDYSLSKGMVVALDMHNYGHRFIGPDYKMKIEIGEAMASTASLVDAWAKIAEGYKGNDKVWLGLMNEPNTHSAERWWRVNQELVNGLRAKGFKNKLLVPGTSWTGAHSWRSSGNAEEAEAFKDPGNNFAFEVHQYLDGDSSGTNADCSAGAAERVDDVITWARSRNVKLFLGETGATDDKTCTVEYPAMLKRVTHSGVFIGWTAWGGGSWWPGDYPFRTLPLDWPGTQKVTPNMRYLLQPAPK